MPSRIEDYALIGNCATAALVARDGSIDWLCWPNFDSEACFAALLGSERNGRWKIAPAGRHRKPTRRYREDTLILETTFETKGGTVEIVDFMPGHDQSSHLVRLVRGKTGSVKMAMELIIRFGIGANVPWVRRLDHGPELLAIGGPDMAVLRTPVETQGKDLTTIAEFEVKAGETIPFVLSYGASHLPVPEAIDEEKALRESERFWRAWIGRCSYEGDYAPIVRRSLLTLKALTYVATGGIVAAPTTSLPERPGGDGNWDYRFCWLRDATFTLLALMNSGFYDEAMAWHNWLLRSAAGAPNEMQIMYGIHGQRRLLEWEAPWLEGYDGAKPVRIGNAAHAQLQLDVFGELMDVFHQCRVAKMKLNGDSWAMERVLLDHLGQIWKEPDSGMWERRGPAKHYVSSKVLAWVAFDRGIKSAEQMGFDAPLDTWRRLRDRIHRDVCAKGFSKAENSFVESYGSRFLDASVLLLPSVGFLPPDDPRIKGTLAAAEKQLMHDGLVLRHDPRQASERNRPAEGAFLACTLWLADAHMLAGNRKRAEALFDKVVAVANDVGLFAEEFDTRKKRQMGNFPQALTHIAIINTAHNLTRAVKPAQQRSSQTVGGSAMSDRR